MTQAAALTILKTGANVFLTGEPGAGKTHVVNEYVAYLRARGVEPAITASTGIAATHIGGLTIHSWSGLGVKTRLTDYDLDKIASTEYVAKRLRRTKVLIIDEVSMLSAEMLGNVEAVCRVVRQSEEAFGGLQIVLVGDFFQLPPVIRSAEAMPRPASLYDGIDEAGGPAAPRFAYAAPAWARAQLLVCYLTEQYRQDDQQFLRILTAIRQNNFQAEHLAGLAARRVDQADLQDGSTKLFSHNVDVDRVNEEMLGRLPGTPRVFTMSAHGREGVVAALKKGCLSPEQLQLKVGAVVMFTKNNPVSGFVNGTLGQVEAFDGLSRQPLVRTRAGRLIAVAPLAWTVEENGRVLGEISQLPLRLAWAITVHKSQGMSLEAAVMDLSQVFEYGQGYVALSRVRRLRGLQLLGWNTRAFQVHPEILDQDEHFRAASEQAAEAFAKLSPEKVTTMQHNFIRACGGSITALGGEGKSQRTYVINRRGERVRVKKVKISTHHQTLEYWNEGKNLREIAKARGLQGTTILSHVEDLVGQGKIPRADLARLLDAKLAAALPDIQATFQALATTALTPIHDHFHGAYSYDELRVVRLMMEE